MPDPFDDLLAQMRAMLDGRDYTALPYAYRGWFAWFAAATEGAW